MIAYCTLCEADCPFGCDTVTASSVAPRPPRTATATRQPTGAAATAAIMRTSTAATAGAGARCDTAAVTIMRGWADIGPVVRRLRSRERMAEDGEQILYLQIMWRHISGQR